MNLLTVRQFSEKHPAFSQSSLRILRFHCESNGFKAAFVTIGRKVLIDESEFFAAIERVNNKPEETCRKKRKI